MIPDKKPDKTSGAEDNFADRLCKYLKPKPEPTLGEPVNMFNPGHKSGGDSNIKSIYSDQTLKIGEELNQKMTEDLNLLARLNNDRFAAMNGDDEAIKRIINIASAFTTVLYSLTTQEPQLFEPHAKKRSTWPVPSTIYPADHDESIVHLKAIGLGSEDISPRKRHKKLNSVPAEEAQQLIDTAHNLHRFLSCIDTLQGLGVTCENALSLVRTDSPVTAQLAMQDLEAIIELPDPLSGSEPTKLPYAQKALRTVNVLALRLAACDSKAWPVIKRDILQIEKDCKGFSALSEKTLHKWLPVLRSIWLEKYNGEPEKDAKLATAGKHRISDEDRKLAVTSGNKQWTPSTAKKHRQGIWEAIQQSMECQIMSPNGKQATRGGKGKSSDVNATSQAKAHPPKSATEGTKPNKKTPGTS